MFTAAALPGQLAQDIAGLPTATYDLGSMLSNSGQAQGLSRSSSVPPSPDPQVYELRQAIPEGSS